jgi:hypothetical protein
MAPTRPTAHMVPTRRSNSRVDLRVRETSNHNLIYYKWRE